MYTLRCRKCRCHLGVEDSLLTWHGEKLDRESKETCYLSDGEEENINVWFIDLETSPSWIQNLVTKGKWMKGKLVCPKCQGRLGSFDFIKTLKCPCLKHELPSVHILKARVDAETTFNLYESSDFRVKWPSSPSSLTKELSQNRQGFFQAVNIQDIGSVNKTEGHTLTIRTPNLIGNIQDNHRPIKILEIQPMAKTEEDSKSFTLCKTLPANDIQKDNLPFTTLEEHSRSCFDTTSAAKVEDKEQMSLMDHDLRWNLVLEGVNLHGQNEESSALRGINLRRQKQESNAVNLSNNSSQSVDENTDVCRNKNVTSYTRVERINSSINKDTSQTANYLMQNRTAIYGDNSENQSVSGSLEGVFFERHLYPDLPSSSNTTRRRKDRRKNRFTVLQDQTPSEVSSSSSTKEEDDTLSVLVIPEENLCAVCLDLYFCPHRCYPCLHVFCEPCLRRLACNQPTNTTCPLCRVMIEHCIPDQDLDRKLRIQFAKAYRTRKHEERKVQQEYYQLPQKGFHFFHYPRNRLLRASPLSIPFVMFKIVFYFLLVYVMFVGVTAIIQWQIYPELANEEFSGMSNSHLYPRTGRSTIIK